MKSEHEILMEYYRFETEMILREEDKILEISRNNFLAFAATFSVVIGDKITNFLGGGVIFQITMLLVLGLFCAFCAMMVQYYWNSAMYLQKKANTIERHIHGYMNKDDWKILKEKALPFPLTVKDRIYNKGMGESAEKVTTTRISSLLWGSYRGKWINLLPALVCFAIAIVLGLREVPWKLTLSWMLSLCG